MLGNDDKGIGIMEPFLPCQFGGYALIAGKLRVDPHQPLRSPYQRVEPMHHTANTPQKRPPRILSLVMVQFMGQRLGQ